MFYEFQKEMEPVVWLLVSRRQLRVLHPVNIYFDNCPLSSRDVLYIQEAATVQNLTRK